MGDLFDYLAWRGDILFSQLPPNDVDALIFQRCLMWILMILYREM